METDAGKTKAQLIEELDRLRQRVVQLETPEGAQDRSAASLHKSEERYRLLFETTGSFTVCLAPDFRILEFNHEAERLSGWKREEILGQDYRKLFLPKADWDAVEANMDQVLAGTPTRNFENCICTKTGKKRTLLWNVTRLLDPDGYPIQTIATGQDITERKRIEAALQESEERYRITGQSISDFAFSYQVSPDGTFVIEWLTDSFTKITGHAVEDLVGKPNILASYIHPDDLGRVVEAVQTLKPGTVNITELRLRTKGGEYRWLGSYAQAVVGKEEGAVQIYGASQDITERKRIEAALQESEERYRITGQSISDFAFSYQVSPNGSYVLEWLTDSFTKLTGYAVEELVGKPNILGSYVHPDDFKRVVETIQTLKPGAVDLTELRFRTKGGGYRWLGSYTQTVAGKEEGYVQIYGACQDITERKRAEDELRESEERYRSLVDMSPDAIYVHTGGKIVYINTAGTQLFGGKSPQDLVGREVLDFIHPDYWDSDRQHVSSIEKYQSASLVERKMIRLDGQVIEVEAAGSLVAYQGQSAIQVVARDVTERKRGEEALRTQALVLEEMSEGVTMLGEDGIIAFTNPAWDAMFGYRAGELIGQHASVFNHPPEEADHIAQRIIASLQEHGAWEGEVHSRKKDGSPFLTYARLKALELNHQKFWVSVQQDITESKQAEEALRTSEERFRTLAAAAPVGIYQADGQGVTLYTNPMWQQISGQTLEETLGFGWLQAIAREEREAVGAEWQQSLQGNHQFSLEYRVVRPDGEVRWVHSQATAIRSETQGELLGYVGTVVDITERKRAETALQQAHDELEQRVVERTGALALANDQLRAEIIEREQAEKALRKSEEHYRAVVEDQTELICRFTPDTQLTFVNDAYCRYFDKSREDLLGRNFLPLLPEKERPAARAHIASLTTHPRVISDEHSVIAANGEARWMLWTDRALLDEHGNVVEFQSVGRDITERKQLEEKLRVGEQLIATGRMAAGVAHEINNPLAGIKNSFLLIKDAVPQNHPHYAFVGRIDKEIDRIANIVRQMYDLYRPQADVSHQFQIVPVVQDVLSMLTSQAQKYGVTLILAPPTRPIQATLPESSLRQVLFNLIKNAIEASPQGREVRTTLACTSESLSLAVIDQGKGISADIRTQIFEPFFSTKKEETHTGMGLGLSISYSLVQAMGGELTFESGPDEGTVFRMTLPLIAQASEIILSGELASIS